MNLAPVPERRKPQAMLNQEDAMTRKDLKSLILKRMDKLDRLYGLENPDPEKYVANERDIVYEVASMMARAGFGELHAAGLALDTRENPEEVKSYLAQCLRALRPGRRRTAPTADLPSDCLTVSQAAKVAGVGQRTVYKLCEEGRLAYHRVGTGRGTIRIKQNDLRRYLEQRRVECRSTSAPKDYLFS
jgi:excisionase family DNA binding protein